MNAEFPAPLRVLTIILAALLGGMVTFVAVLLALKPPGPLIPDDELHRIMFVVLGVLTLSELPAYFILRTAKMSQLRKSLGGQDATTAGPQLAGEYVTLTIVAAAMAEGVGLFGCVLYLLSTSPLALFAPFLACLVLVALWPTQFKFDCFVESATRKQVM